MNFLEDAWVPVRSGVGGSRERIGLEEAMDRPLFDIQSGRPDFDFSIILFAIGLRQTGYQPAPLFGDGPRFLQSKVAEERCKRSVPIGQLLLDEPGEQVIKEHRDLFVRGNRRNSLCPSCAALALYSKSLFGGPGGRGLHPSPLFHSTVYLRTRATLGETVEANLVEGEVPAEAYFSASQARWLADPEDGGVCALCGATGPVFREFYRSRPERTPEHVDSPHAAKTHSGKRFSVGPSDATLKAVDGAVVGSQVAIPPPAILERSDPGDSVWCFGTHYKKAALQRIIFHAFDIGQPVDWRPLKACVHSVLECLLGRDPRRADYDSMKALEVRSSLSEKVLQGGGEREAALDVFDQFCSSLGGSRRYFEGRRRLLEFTKGAHGA